VSRELVGGAELIAIASASGDEEHRGLAVLGFALAESA
jgi:hypothetical protein